LSRLNLTNEETSNDQHTDVVSVIIPAYNAAAYIKETLDSVFAQTYQSFEIIVVNDGSPDTPALEEVLLPYRDRIVYLTQENRGLSGARNTGLRAATGSMVALLDADDIWLPDYLEQQTTFLRQHPEYDLVYCNALFFGESIYDGKKYMNVCLSEGEATSAAIISRRCHVFVSVTARTEILKRFGFDESLRSCEDFDCWLRFTAAGHRIGYHRKVLVRYRKHAASLSADPTGMANYNLRVLTNSLGLWPEGSEEKRLLLQAKATKTAEIENFRGKSALRNQDIPAAIAHLRAANSFYKSAKISAVIFLLRVAPSSVVALFKLRGLLLPSYHESAK
jgi:glycosyltransferase involved in cell wall biosynthesis